MIFINPILIVLGLRAAGREAPPDSLNGCGFIGGAALSFIGGMIVTYNGLNGLTGTMISVDAIAGILLLAVLGAVMYSVRH